MSQLETNNAVWQPQPGSQQLFLACPHFEVLYEGTRGPGKTDALLMDFAQHVGHGYGPDWRGVIFRREYKELGDVINKSKKWFRQMFPGARFLESTDKLKWVFRDGEELLFRTASRADDYWNYHGHEYPFIAWEELTSWPDLELYSKMMSVCRSTNPYIPRKYRSTANPYGPGHNVVKARFIDIAPAGVAVGEEFTDPVSGRVLTRRRVRIHGTIWENLILLESDPEYLQTLLAIKDPNLRRAWLHGDWDIVAGGAVDDVWNRDVHVLRPFRIPSSWYVDRSFDWGSTKPFSVGWWAESDGTPVTLADGTRRTYPKGWVIRIGEWYGWNGTPNEGLRLTDQAIGKGIREHEEYLRESLGVQTVNAGPADTAIFDADPGKDSIAHGINAGYWGKSTLANRNIFTEADKRPGSRVRRLQTLRRRLSAALEPRPEEPGLSVFDTCTDGFLRTVPVLPRDKRNPDDIDTEAEDHVADETGYRLTAARKTARRVRVRLS
ncbi:MAG: hypothetical protein WD492_12870 [Alkalispirochaeta sp.]